MKEKMKRLEDAAGKLCDEYCKFPSQSAHEDVLDKICMACPLNDIFELVTEDFIE